MNSNNLYEKRKHEKKKKLERFRRFSYETQNKLSRLSHEELMIPLVYWQKPPKHRITAMYVQKSMRSGDIIVTGSDTGEFIIWKPSNIMDAYDTNHQKNGKGKKHKVKGDGNHWIPIAMSFSTNTSPIISILGSFQHKEQAAFMACHADGETVIFSVYGAGALKIGCGDRAIIGSRVSGMYGFGLSNESYQYCVATNYFNHSLHLIDLHKGKEIKTSVIGSATHDTHHHIIDIAFFELQLSSHCAMIDSGGCIATFCINCESNAIESQLHFDSRLKNEAIAIGITFDNKYLCAISRNEFVIFAHDPMRFISYFSSDEQQWDGMLVLDKYLYGIIASSSLSSHDKLIDIDSEYNNATSIECIRPFFVLLWRSCDTVLTIYVVSLDGDCLVSPVVQLVMPFSCEWDVVRNDNRSVFVATSSCELITFSLDEIEAVARRSCSAHSIGVVHGCVGASIADGFGSTDNEIWSSHLAMTSGGVMLCLGYSTGEIYVYCVSTGEAVMEIHTSLSSVCSLLLFCGDRMTSSGVLFVGYCSGLVEAFSMADGSLQMSCQCHFGRCELKSFPNDYYVFSIGSEDNALCSFLVLNELAHHCTGDIRMNWYRGHSSSIVDIYRNEWCLICDFVCCELCNGEIYVWCVSTAQLERRLNRDKSFVFSSDRRFSLSLRRCELPHLTRHDMDIYGSAMNVVVLDIRVLGYGNDSRKLSDILSLLVDYFLVDYWSFNCLIGDICPCYGHCGDFDSVSLLFPCASRDGGRWRIQPKVSAVYMLAINTICMWLLGCVGSGELPICSQLVTFYHCELAESLCGFVEPSRNSMARYCLNSVSEIRGASRMLLHGIVQRMSDQQRLSLIFKWKSRFCNNKIHSSIPLSVLLGAIVICIIHSLRRQSIDDAVCQSVVSTLMKVLMEKVHTNSDMIKISLAADYLGKVIICWFKYVDDVEYLLSLLLDLRNCDHALLKKSASTCLLQCGVAVPQSFIKTMGNEALQLNEQEYEKKRHEQALMCIINLVQKYPQVLLKHIPLLVSTIIRCLDPSAPRRRKALLSATTASLHVLVTKYPNVAFHQETQHFAIGTGPARDNCILIYDLRTTTRWKQLKGHRAAVTAVEFNYNGQYLISYSAYERPPTVKCWYVKGQGFFNSLLSINNHHYLSHKCIKTCPMPPLDRLYPPIDHLQYTKLTWNQKVKGAVKLQRENKSVLFFTVLPK
eukprot:108475_1